MSSSNLSPYSSHSSQNSPYHPNSNSYSMYQPVTPELTSSPHSTFGALSPEASLPRLPRLTILAQPQPKFRFRYQSEMIGTHGCLMAESKGNSQSRKSYIQVKLDGFHGKEAIVRCSLVTNEKEPKPHVHRLVGEGNSGSVDSHSSDFYDVVLPGNQNEWIATFTGLTIIHTGKKQVREVLEKRLLRENGFLQHQMNCRDGRNLSSTEERKVKDDADHLATRMDLHSVRLKFEAFSQENGILMPICEPLYSNSVHNLKSTSAADLRIVRVDKVVSSCVGNEEVFIFVEKVNKKDIKVKFFQLEDDEREVWSAFAEFSELDVHHQYAIAFKTPPYRDQDIKEDVKVLFQLYRPSNNSVSEPRLFTYKPREDLNLARKRRYEINTVSASSTAAKRIGIFDTPSSGNGGRSPSSSFQGNGDSPSGAENSRSPQGPVHESQDHRRQFLNQQQTTFPLQFDRNIASLNVPLLQNERQQEFEPSTMFPIYVPAPEMLSRGTSQNQPVQTFSISQQQTYAEPNILLDENVSSFLHPQAQQQQPVQYSMEPIRSEDIQDIDQWLALFNESSANADPIAYGQDYVQADACKVESNQQTQDITDQLKKMSIQPEEKKENNEKIRKLDVVDVVRRLSLDLASDLRSYAETGTLSGLLQRTVYLLALQSEDGDNALHCALWNNQLDVFHAMLGAAKQHEACRDLINSTNDLNLTPLHLAVIMNNCKAATALLEAGADPSIPDKEGNSPIHVAAKDPELLVCLRLLLGNGNQVPVKSPSILNLLNYEGLAPLHLAVSAASLEAAKLLVQAGADPNVTEAKTGKAPLHVAVEKRNSDIVRYLLSLTKVNVNQQSYDGSTPLHVAVNGGTEEICLALIQKGADRNMNSFVDIFSCGLGSERSGDAESDDGKPIESDEDEEVETGKKGISPLELAKLNPSILKLLTETQPFPISSTDIVVTDSVKLSSGNETSSRALDSGFDIMASRELLQELDDNVIDKLSRALESAASDCWKTLARTLDIPAALMGTVENQKSPTTYILQNLDVWGVSPQFVMEKCAEMKLHEAVNILDDYLKP